MIPPYASMALGCGIGGWLLFLSLFCPNLPVERLFGAKQQWVLLGVLLLALACSISAIIFGHKGYSQDNPAISDTFLTGAGLVLTYLFWYVFINMAPLKRYTVVVPLLLLALLCGIGGMVLGYISSGTLMALAALVLGYAQLPILAIGILFAIIPWHNSYQGK